ncbi:hypothetical protein QBC44DRAFT_382245 [Cladorrhinum sp. PSN332]|nr:hypothetical protein QBC44DRAFT_382245 [Cladorrhinum sp. PSN332]
MRLINTKNFKLEEFLEHETPPYAILSHTWGDDVEEISFREAQEGNFDKPGIGSIKFRGSCQQAAKDGLGYVWIDTCCIDKGNLVELSEAINSMFRWYKRSSFCYAYIGDVPADDQPRVRGSKFRSSRWFTRGWTLQELLAPKYVRFYNSSWDQLGNKGTMSSILEEITGIPRQYLLGITRLQTASVAQRMAWAAQRITKRPEDLAYCLLGIFGVSMPMIYGEGGDQAFLRLQEHIMRTTRDDSMLSWGLKDSDAELLIDQSLHQSAGRVMATTPASFTTSRQIVSREQSSQWPSSLEISGGSLRICIPLVIRGPNEVIALLNCGPESNTSQRVGIPLVKVQLGANDQYARPKGADAVLYPTTSLTQNFWLFDHDAFAELGLELVEVIPRSCWDQERTIVISAETVFRNSTRHTLARFRHNDRKSVGGESPDFLLLLELKDTPSATEPAPQYHFMICSRETRLEEIWEKKDYVGKRVSGKNSASNGQIHVHVALKPEHGNSMFIIKPEQLSEPTVVTVDITLELKRTDLMARLEDMTKERRMVRAEFTMVQNAVQANNDRLRRVQGEREAVEEKIKKLERRRNKLVEDEKNNTYELKCLKGQERAMKGKLGYLTSRWEEAQGEWHQLFNTQPTNTTTDMIQVCELKRPCPILWAAANNCAEMVAFCLEEGADRPITRDGIRAAFILASCNGYDSVVRQFLSHKVDMNITDPNGYGRTALGTACLHGRKSVVETLIETGKADVNVQDKEGWTPLRLAVQGGHVAIVELLLQANADMTIKGKDGSTPLSIAIQRQNTQMVRLFQDRGKEMIRIFQERAKGSSSMTPAPTKKQEPVSHLDHSTTAGYTPSSPNILSDAESHKQEAESSTNNQSDSEASYRLKTESNSPTGPLLSPPQPQGVTSPRLTRSRSPSPNPTHRKPRAPPPLPAAKDRPSLVSTSPVFRPGFASGTGENWL